MPPQEFDPIADIQLRLRRFPQARYDAGTDYVVVHPLDAAGFRVEFRVIESRYVIFCEGWHDEFRDVDDALHVFALALSTAARLEVHRRGSTDHRWILQRREEATWISLGEVGLVFLPFWRRPVIVHLQNRLLEAA